MTKLVGSDPVEFEQPEYEVTVPENTSADHLLRLSARVQATGRSLAKLWATCRSHARVLAAGRFPARLRVTGRSPVRGRATGRPPCHDAGD